MDTIELLRDCANSFRNCGNHLFNLFVQHICSKATKPINNWCIHLLATLGGNNFCHPDGCRFFKCASDWSGAHYIYRGVFNYKKTKVYTPNEALNRFNIGRSHSKFSGVFLSKDFKTVRSVRSFKSTH